MQKGKFPAVAGVVVKSAKNGQRYLLHDKDSCGKDIYVTIPVVDTDTKKDYLDKVEKARIKLIEKKNINLFADMIDEYITIRQLRPNSARGLRCALKGFGLDDTHNRAAFLYLLKSGQKSVQTKAHRISAFYKYLIVYKHMPISDPTNGVRIHYSPKRDRIMTDDETNIFFERMFDLPEEIQLVLRLAYYTGARVSTILAIDAKTYRGGKLHYYNTKCGRPYAYPIPLVDPESVRLIKDFTKSGGKFKLTNSAILNRVYKFFRQNFLKKDGQTLTIHSLRHTLATRLLQAGVSPDVISRILDHKSVSTTLSVYATHSDVQISDALDRIF